MPEDVLSGRNM